MRKLALFALFVPFCLGLLGCGKDKPTTYVPPKPLTPEEQLPKATQEGKNTFGFLLNGQAWLPSSSIDVFADYNHGELNLWAQNIKTGSKIRQYFNIYFWPTNPIYKSGEYQLSNWRKQGARYNDYGISCHYYTDSLRVLPPGKVLFTKFDTINRIISGTFEMDMLAPGCDTLHITKGRFDL